MKALYLGDVALGTLNAVALQNAVLCAECDVVSDSPHDWCMVCGSRSLFNISRMLGGSLPKNRATVIETDTPKANRSEFVLSIGRAHKIRRRLSA
jgi:hypothetical protein